MYIQTLLTNEMKYGAQRKTCPSVILSTTNPTCIDPGTNPGLRSERPVTDGLSHGSGYFIILYCGWLLCKLTDEDGSEYGNMRLCLLLYSVM
jgi:hypothetical protein